MLYQSNHCYSGDKGRPAQAPATTHRVLICQEPWSKTGLAAALYPNGTVGFRPKAVIDQDPRQTVPHVRFRVVSRRAVEPLKPHATQSADIAQLRIVADRTVAALARQE